MYEGMKCVHCMVCTDTTLFEYIRNVDMLIKRGSHMYTSDQSGVGVHGPRRNELSVVIYS